MTANTSSGTESCKETSLKELQSLFFKKTRVSIRREGIVKYVFSAEDLSSHLKQGWELGDLQKTQHKKWYNNGKEQRVFKEGDPIPEGFTKGMLPHPGTFSACKYHWYHKGSESLRIKEGDPIPPGYFPGQTDDHKKKNSLGGKNLSHVNSKNYSQEFKDLYNSKEKSITFLKNNFLSQEELKARFTCGAFSVTNWLSKYSLWSYLKKDEFAGTSREEKSLLSFLEEKFPSLAFESHNRSILKGKELDIYCPELKIAIEFNGTRWHSLEMGTTKTYHQEKTLNCMAQGIRLIHIYEPEWCSVKSKEKITMFLINIFSQEIPCIPIKECTSRIISREEELSYLNKYYLGEVKPSSLCYGLFYKEELVQTLGVSIRKKKGKIQEICSNLNYKIPVNNVLLNKFLKERKPSEINYLCDLNKFTGSTLQDMGFIETKILSPKKHRICSFTLYDAGSKEFIFH